MRKKRSSGGAGSDADVASLQVVRADDRRADAVNRIQYEIHLDGDVIRLTCDFRLLGLNKASQLDTYYHPSPAHTRIFMFAKGGCTVATREGEVEMVPGSIYLIPTAQAFRVKYDIVELYYAHLDAYDSSGISITNGIRGVRCLEDPGGKLRDDLVRSWRNGATRETELAFLRALLRFLEPDMAQLKDRTSRFHGFGPVIEHIKTHVEDALTVNELARLFHRSRTALTRAFKKATGSTLKDYIARVRIDEAKRLLTLSERSVEQVASAVGFGDPPHFYRVFKKLEGMTPGEFRRVAHELIL